MPNETIEIGRVLNDKTKDPVCIVTLTSPEDPDAKAGMPPMINISSGHVLPVFAERVARLLVEASDRSAELWPDWAKRLIQLTNGPST